MPAVDFIYVASCKAASCYCSSFAESHTVTLLTVSRPVKLTVVTGRVLYAMIYHTWVLDIRSEVQRLFISS